MRNVKMEDGIVKLLKILNNTDEEDFYFRPKVKTSFSEADKEVYSNMLTNKYRYSDHILNKNKMKIVMLDIYYIEDDDLRCRIIDRFERIIRTTIDYSNKRLSIYLDSILKYILENYHIENFDNSMKYNEIFRLEKLLKDNNINFEIRDMEIDGIKNIIIFNNSGNIIANVIQGNMTYGCEKNLLEISGDILTSEEKELEIALGNVTANEVLQRVLLYL